MQIIGELSAALIVRNGGDEYWYESGRLKQIRFRNGMELFAGTDGGDILWLAHDLKGEDWLFRREDLDQYRTLISLRNGSGVELLFDYTNPDCLLEIKFRKERETDIHFSYVAGLLSKVVSGERLLIEPTWNLKRSVSFLGMEYATPIQMTSDGIYAYEYFRKDIWTIMSARTKGGATKNFIFNVLSGKGTYSEDNKYSPMDVR